MRRSPSRPAPDRRNSPGRLGAAATLALAALLTALPGAPRGASADTIHLKDGKTITGVVDENASDSKRLAVKTVNGTIRIMRDRIDRIETRENMSPEEKSGDLAAHDGDLDRALELYLKALAKDDANEILKEKVADTKTRIRERDDRKYGQQFEKLQKMIEAREFDAAIETGRELADNLREPSVKERCRQLVAEAYVQKARDARNTVAYPQAERAYRDAVEVYPKNAIATLELADLVQTYPTRQDEAIGLFRDGIALALADPTLVDPDALLAYRASYAKIHWSNAKYRDAARFHWEVVLADAKEKYPQSLDYVVRSIRFIQPELVEKNDANEEIVAILRGVIERKPLEDKAHYLLGKTLFERNDYDAAIPVLEKAIANMGSGFGSPDFPEAHYSLGLAYRSKDRDRDAIVAFEKTLELQPERYEVMCELGEIRFELAEYDRALIHFQAAIETDEASYRAYLGAGRTLRRVNRFVEAAKMYERLVEIRDDNPEYFFELALTYAQIDKHEEAIATYNRVLTLLADADREDPKNREFLGETYARLGLSILALKRYNESIEQLDKSLEFKPAYALALDGKGQAFREIGRLGDAETSFKAAIAADPDNPAFLLNLGTFYHNFKQDTKTALTYYLAYFEKGGSDPAVYDWIRECGGTPPGQS